MRYSIEPRSKNMYKDMVLCLLQEILVINMVKT